MVALPLSDALSDATFYAWFFSFTHPLLLLLNKAALCLAIIGCISSFRWIDLLCSSVVIAAGFVRMVHDLRQTRPAPRQPAVIVQVLWALSSRMIAFSIGPIADVDDWFKAWLDRTSLYSRCCFVIAGTVSACAPLSERWTQTWRLPPP